MLIDLRCPFGLRKLLGRCQQNGEPVVVNGDNLFVLPCRDCRNAHPQRDGERPKRVLHKFEIDGTMAGSEVEW